MQAEERKTLMQNQRRCYNCLNNSHTVDKCFSRYRCRICQGKHHTLLHLDTGNSTTNNVVATPNDVIDNQPHTSNTVNALQANVDQITLLPTAMVNVKNYLGSWQRCRVLLDSGSQTSFITSECIQRLRLPIKNAKIVIRGLGQTNAGSSIGKTAIELSSIYDNNIQLQINALVIPKITSAVPTSNFDVDRWDQLRQIQLADPMFNAAASIDILIGADQFFHIMGSGKIISSTGLPIAQQTIFGWVVAGAMDLLHDLPVTQQITNLYTESEVDQTLRKFWETEELPTSTLLTEEEKYCENHFVKTTTKTSTGRYMVSLPFKQPHIRLGQTYHLAMNRLSAMERRFKRDPEFHQLYKDFMKEYEDLDHMIKIQSTDLPSDTYFLPHHGVMKASSTTTKLRVVFDGSAATTSGNSLNSALMVGPTIQQSLYSILLRFRQYRIAITGDMAKMYRQILVHPTDRKYQTILWRRNVNEEVRYYQLATVTYGTAPASFLATRVLNEIANEFIVQYPKASTILKNDVYVDDLMTGAETINEATQIYNQLNQLLEPAGFHLRKWSSNSEEFIVDIPVNDREVLPINLNQSEQSIKVLGVQWHPKEDYFKFIVNLDGNIEPTKRTFLSEASKIFDPLGLTAPVIINIKILFQSLWLLKLEWDDPLPDEVKLKWMKLRSALLDLRNIEIPRWIQTQGSHIQIHGFADASEVAYAAVVFCRTQYDDGEIKCNLLTAKTKVAPLKQLSRPKLELCAARLLANLLEAIKGSMSFKIDRMWAWTDSTIVLDWLSINPRDLITYVANRTSEILSVTSRDEWNHVPSHENPADCASRGILPEELSQKDLWWSGPKWLRLPETEWPIQNQRYSQHDVPCLKPKRLLVHTNLIENDLFQMLTTKHSSFNTLCRILSYILRFCKNCKSASDHRVSGDIMRDEIFEAEQYWIRWHQQDKFADEISSLRQMKPVKNSSKLISLDPFMDKHGVLRVGGRLKQSNATYDIKHPAIITQSSLVYLLARDIHFKYFHAGPTLMIKTLLQRFHIIGARNFIRKIIHECTICARYKAVQLSQLMGELPPDRVNYNRPFIKVGVDYAGPFDVNIVRKRGQRPVKMYVCVFVCLSTKAVHIEMVADLTTEAFLACLRRMFSRRGAATDVYSDNGTNFIGANNYLKNLYIFLKQNCNKIFFSLSRDLVNWHFNVPGASHANGLYEAAIKSMKFHLRRVIGQNILTYDEFSTLLVQVEALLNSRPLCIIQPHQLDVLTPGHFLIGHPLTLMPDKNLTTEKQSLLTKWQIVQQKVQQIWKRWHEEYLTSLQRRVKWRDRKDNIRINDVVLIRDENLPPTNWAMAIVEEVHPGKDGFIRAVTLRTKASCIRRPIQKLVRLPVESGDSRAAECL